MATELQDAELSTHLEWIHGECDLKSWRLYHGSFYDLPLITQERIYTEMYNEHRIKFHNPRQS